VCSSSDPVLDMADYGAGMGDSERCGVWVAGVSGVISPIGNRGGRGREGDGELEELVCGVGVGVGTRDM